MKRSTGKLFFISAIFCLLAHASLFGNTWYVDPVNGSDLYDGTSPFHIPNTPVGPTQTIEQAVNMTSQYDILVLADGMYSGQYNTEAAVFDMIDMRHLYVTSANGPDHCILTLHEQVYLDNPVYSPDELDTYFSDLTFTSIIPSYMPGPFYIQNQSRLCFKECVFTGFQTTFGLIYIDSANPVFDGCRFENNQMRNAIRCMWDASPTIKNCSFTNNANSSDYMSALVEVREYCSLTMENCTFSDNRSTYPLYAVYALGSNSLRVADCVFEKNTSSEYCAGIYFESSDGGFISGTRFENLQGVGVFADMCEGLFFVDCQFTNNQIGVHLQLWPDKQNDIEFHNCEFIGNTISSSEYPDPSVVKQGGIFVQCPVPAMDLDIRECTFKNNFSGVMAWEGVDFASFNVTNCLFTNNIFNGLAVNNTYSHINPEAYGRLNVNQCTFSENGQYEFASNYAIVENTILRHMPNHTIVDTGGVTLNYCNILGGWTGPGIGNIDVDPLFAEPGVWHPDPQQGIPGTDFHLKSTAGRWDPDLEYFAQDSEDSPCIDSGDPSVVSFFESYGSGGRINMGVYGNTWQASLTDRCSGGYRGSGMLFGDINRDCTVNLADFAVTAENWLQSTLIASPIPD